MHGSSEGLRVGRLGPLGREAPVVVDGAGQAYGLADLTHDVDGAFLAADGLARATAAFDCGALQPIDATGLRVGAPIARPQKIVCIGLNYRDHAEETGVEPPSEPAVFLKAPNTIVGPNDDVLIPRGSTKTDWEVELAVVMGARAHYLASPADAAGVIAGYCVANDVSERAFQLERGGQWDKGKSCETFLPLGPWLVPAEAVADPQALSLRTWVNGTLRQDGSTSEMLFGVHHVIWYVSQFMVLEPGDVVNTGTPAGVALGLPGQPYLREGDLVELEIDGLGRQRQCLRSAER